MKDAEFEPCWVCCRPMDGLSEEDCHCFHRKELRLNHGVDCVKAAHVGGGQLHAPDDDRPYDVDGQTYCGRCHHWLDDIIDSARKAPATPTGSGS